MDKNESATLHGKLDLLLSIVTHMIAQHPQAQPIHAELQQQLKSFDATPHALQALPYNAARRETLKVLLDAIEKTTAPPAFAPAPAGGSGVH
jgi:hypothetical protein